VPTAVPTPRGGSRPLTPLRVSSAEPVVRPLADGVYQITGLPPNAINVYLIGDVLVDAGTRLARRRILTQVAGRNLQAHVATHAHADHLGSSLAICTALNIPMWAGAADRESVETGNVPLPAGPLSRPLSLFKAPPLTVARTLSEGDDVAGFTVDVPGHSPGHIALWREADHVLLCGDVNFHLLLRPAKPPAFLTLDPELNRQSMERLAALDPRLVLFGHGRPARFDGKHNRLTVQQERFSFRRGS
jgi:hydroxyacylglutathione hydrolase